MQDLRITTVQSNQIWEDKPANLARYESLIENISATDLIIFPEMFHTGFSMNVDALVTSLRKTKHINEVFSSIKKKRNK